MITSLPLPEATDDALRVEHSLQGDTQAFGCLVQRHQAVVCGLTLSMSGNVHASQDLAQETFIAAWRQLRDLRERGNVRGWLCGIARHVAASFLRKQQRLPAAQALPLEEAAKPRSTAPDSPGPRWASPPFSPWRGAPWTASCGSI